LPRYGYVYPQDVNQDVLTRLELEIKYEGYLKRQQEELQRFDQAEKINIPENIDYMSINTLSWEAREKLNRIRPLNIGQVLRIPGVNYTDAAALMIWLRKYSPDKKITEAEDIK
jgi:tRNA uridine 5-carboxymethylaminomethyl modification enzyme